MKKRKYFNLNKKLQLSLGIQNTFKVKKQTLNLFIIIFLFFIYPLFVNAQSGLICDYCGEKITGKYIQAENKIFHPNHFLCSRCKKVISGSSIVKDDEFYHPDCYALSEGLVCGYCKKIIESEYIEESGKKYHKNCFENNVAPRCSICDKPLMEEYSKDIYGNVYHSYHDNELDRCDNCSRLISENVTGGGKDYNDGRHICNLCYKDAIFNTQKFNSLFKQVLERLKSFGLKYKEEDITIKAVDRNGLRQAAGSHYNKNMRGYCRSEEESKYINGKFKGKTNKHTIYIINGIPALNIEAVIAHELTHVWLVENTRNNHSDELREGSCNFIAFLYLTSIGNTRAEQIIKAMENNEDIIYGKGFMAVKSKFANNNLNRLISYLKTKKDI